METAMIMSDADILKEYHEAANKRKQVEILADENCVRTKEMVRWLHDHGEKVDGRLLATGKPKDRKKSQPERFEAILESVDAGMRNPDQSTKADAGKPRLTLVPMQILFDIAEVREYGCTKYGDPDNWKRVEAERYREAAFRHFLAYIRDPAGVDPESGLPHLWHLACNIAFLCEKEKDDES